MTEYGRLDALLNERAALPRVKTPEELETGLMAAISAAQRDAGDELFYAACRAIRGARYRDESGVWHDVMSDFMMTYLLRKMIVSCVAETSHPDAAPAGSVEEGEGRP